MESKNTRENIDDWDDFFEQAFNDLQHTVENENLGNLKISEMPESKTDRYQRAEEIAQQIIDENFQKKEETEEILKNKKSQIKQDKEIQMELFQEEALETLREILENNRELSIKYERIKRYYSC